MTRRLGFALLFLTFALGSSAQGRDWIHWRGPEQTGFSREKGLPDSFDLKAGKKGNVLWTQPFGGRSAPLVLDGRLYINQGFGTGYEEAERVLCFDEKTGKQLWEYRENVYHADIVTNRLGWTSMTADPATGHVYAHLTSGALVCLDKTGKVVWQRQLTEEFGRTSGYGGRLVSPIFDSGMVIVGMINSSWGDQGRGANRFAAFDANTGQVVWWSEPGGTARPLTYQSNPVVAVINGQRLLISGGAQGTLLAMKVRTGELVWSYQFADGAINPSPVVNGNLVYCAHGEENPEGGPIGRVFCVDGSQVDPKTKKPKLVWEYRRANRFGLASPAFAYGMMLMPEDTGDLYAFNGKTGKLLWKYRYASEVRGAPLVAEHKIYIFDVKGRLNIIPLDPKNPMEEPSEADVFEYKFRASDGLLNETNGTPVAVNGRVYFVTRTDLIAIGDPESKGECDKYAELPLETTYDPAAAPVAARVFPAEVTANAGAKLAFKLVPLDANGREVKPANAPQVEWSLPTPPPPPAPKGADPKAPAPKGPPPLKGQLAGDGAAAAVAIDPAPPAQNGYVQASLGEVTARARVRVAATIPFKQDFTNVPDGAAPGGWVNAQGKYSVKQLPDGNKVLAKFNGTGPQPVVKANTFITTPDSAGYVMEADLMGTQVGGKMADGGIINSRYTLVLDGKTDPDLNSRTLRLTSWEARPRLNLGTALNWQPDTWYRLKLVVEAKEHSAVVRGKVWKKGDAEPEKWSIEFEDPSPNRGGAAGLYGYVSNGTATDLGSAMYYDNVTITPSGK